VNVREICNVENNSGHFLEAEWIHFFAL